MDRQTALFVWNYVSKKIFIIHSPEAFGFFRSQLANKLNNLLFPIIKIIQNRVMKNSDLIVVLNKYMKKQLENRDFRNVVRIPNGIDTENFSNKGDENFILYAGRFDWNKNVCSLIRAFASLEGKHVDICLCLVGEGTQERRIRKIMKEKKITSRVTILPWLPRMKLSKLISKCTVFVLPSLFEAANPVVIMESMASSKPVIAKKNIGTIDIIVHGKNGFLYESEEELTKQIESLISDINLRKRIGFNGEKTVKMKYDFPVIADRYEELLLNLM